MKPGAMNSFAQVASPYHTIQVTPTQKVPIMKKNSKKKSSASSTKDNNSKAAIPYTTSDNNLELYGAMFKNQRSNSWCEASEEALQHPGGAGHFSPLNTVAGSIVIFYTEILAGKVILWCFFSSETSEKIHNSTFQVKISV